MGVVDDPIEDRVGKRRGGDGAMPVGDRELAGDEGAGLVEPVVDDFQEVAAELLRERSQAEVIEYEQLDAREALEERALFALGAGGDEMLGQPRQAVVAHAAVLATGFFSPGTGGGGLFHTRRAG